MDARIDPLALLDLELGDAHVLRNGGAIVTDDVHRSLAASREIGSRDVVVIGHTDCGLGPGEEERVREAVAELRASAPGDSRVSGYVLDVGSGELREIV
jgi:carbonic anhydrase